MVTFGVLFAGSFVVSLLRMTVFCVYMGRGWNPSPQYVDKVRRILSTCFMLHMVCAKEKYSIIYGIFNIKMNTIQK